VIQILFDILHIIHQPKNKKLNFSATVKYQSSDPKTQISEDSNCGVHCVWSEVS